MKNKNKKNISIKCSQCGHENVFNQPFQYHAGFANQGFLYNEKGNRTLVWSSFDPDYESIVGECHPWALTKEQQQKIEAILASDNGGRWLFENPARCKKCEAIISEPMMKNITYLVYDESIHLDQTDSKSHGLKDIMKK
jgi:hypothetical protein